MGTHYERFLSEELDFVALFLLTQEDLNDLGLSTNHQERFAQCLATYTSLGARCSLYTVRIQSINMHTEHIYSHIQSIYTVHTAHIQVLRTIHSAYMEILLKTPLGVTAGSGFAGTLSLGRQVLYGECDHVQAVDVRVEVVDGLVVLSDERFHLVVL